MPATAIDWGSLWGARPEDWATSEAQQWPVYEAAIARAGLRAGARVLDVACGAGTFLGLAADRGAEPSGIDAAAPLIELARRRVPAADLRVGDMEALPFEDDGFDLVTSFTALAFADDPVAALREACRVARPGGTVFVQVWGRPEHCELEAMKVIVRPFMPAPAPPSDAAAPPPLWRPGVLDGLAAAAGLRPAHAFDLTFAYEYSDADALGRALLAPMGLGEVVGPEREPAVRDAIVAAMAPCRTADGGYRIANEFRCLVARVDER